MRHICLVVQYDGTAYSGFQIQPNGPTIQANLEQSLTALLGETVKVTGASRTDAGVHACGQVVTFTSENVIPVDRLVPALNALLPQDIACVVAKEVSQDFHPQYLATRKRYSYRILNRPLRSPFLGRYTWHIRQPLDIGAMREAGRYLVGEHDFAAFCAAGGSAKTSVREIYGLDLLHDADVIEVQIEGNGFLYMMVRIIVGTLVEIGLKKMPPARMREILASKDRCQAGATAPPQGLTLVRVEYQ